MFYLAFFFVLGVLASRRFLQRTQRGPETHIEEKQPETIPNAMGIAKVRSEVRPASSETTIIVIIASVVVVVVKMLRLTVWKILVFTTS